MNIEQKEYIQFLKKVCKTQLTEASRAHTLLETAIRTCSIANLGSVKDMVDIVLEACKDELSHVEEVCIGIYNEQMNNNWRHFGVSIGLPGDWYQQSEEWVKIGEEQLPQRLENGFLVPLKHQNTLLGLMAVIETATSGDTDDDIRRRQAYVEDLARVVSVAINNGFIVEKVYEPFEGIIGDSDAIKEVIEMVNQFADSELTILIQGKSGVGKELFAKMIHKLSGRKNEPFVAFNCGVFTETLEGSELFGHEKGAFTGAFQRNPGRFERAGDGTIFLDEVDSMPPSMQVKLLRVLEEKEFEPVGWTKPPKKTNARIIAATKIDLEEASKKGNFREDLYYRLNVISIDIPPLCERKDDIPALAKHFLDQQLKDKPNGPQKITQEALNCLMNYDWAGNVRQLKHTIIEAFYKEKTKAITPDSLPPRVANRLPDEFSNKVKPGGLEEEMASTEQRMISEALNECGGNITRTAKKLEISRQKLYRRIKKYDIKYLQKNSQGIDLTQV